MKKLWCMVRGHKWTLFGKRDVKGFRTPLHIRECGRCGRSEGVLK